MNNDQSKKKSSNPSRNTKKFKWTKPEVKEIHVDDLPPEARDFFESARNQHDRDS